MREAQLLQLNTQQEPLKPVLVEVWEPPSRLENVITSAVDATATLAAAGLGGAFLAEQATWAAADHYGGILGEQIAGPIAGVAGGVVGTALGSLAYQSMPRLDYVCPRRAQPTRPGLESYSMTSNHPAAPRLQEMEWVESQRRMLEEQCAATKLAQQESLAAKNVIRDLQFQIAVTSQSESAAVKATGII